MKTLLIGGTGFTGKRVLPLLAKEMQVRLLVRPGKAAPDGLSGGVKPVTGTLDDPQSIATALEGCDGLVCLASLGFGHGANLVRVAQEANLRKCLFVSTTSVFTQLNPDSKQVRLAAEKAIKDSSLNWTIIRPTMIYGGPDDRNMIRLLKLIKRLRMVPVPGSGQNLMQPVFVEDLAMGIVDAFTSPRTIGKAYNLSGATPHSFREIVRLAASALGKPVALFPLPAKLMVRLLGLYEKRVGNPRIKAEQILRLNEDKDFSHQEAAADFGFAPRDYAQGILDEARAAGMTTK